MDLLLQVSEKELEEFPEPPVDHTDQDKPDKSNTGGTHSSNISHQLQTQTQTSAASEAPKVSTASLHSSQKHRYRQLAMQPVTSHTFTYRKGQCDQSCAHIPLIADATGGTQLKDIFQDPLPRSSKVFAFRNLHR